MKIAFLFLISAALSSIGFCQDDELPQEIAKWEDSIAKLEARNESDRLEQNDVEGILFYGSSSIRLWNSIREDMAPWPVIQRGYGGAKLPDAIHYAQRVVGPHIGASNLNRCRAVVVFIANDIGGKDNDATPEEVGQRFQKLHSWLREIDPDIPFFWIEVTPTNSRWEVWPEIEQATRLIAETIDRDSNSHLIHTAGPYLGTDGKPKSNLFLKDQLHLNLIGYQQWAILIKAQLHGALGAAAPLLDQSK